MPEQFKHLRDQIDAIDHELLKLFNYRAELAQKIGKIKKNAVIYRPEREAQILSRLQQLNPGPLSNKSIRQLFTEVMSCCRALEKPMTVAFLGPNGTFSEEAALKHFGSAITTLPCDSIDEVFLKVESNTANYGVVPVENSTEGAVGRTMDLLLQTPLTVCGEIQLPIHQFLMAQHNDLSQIKKIYSHPQSFSQCHNWLKKNFPDLPDSARISTPSNSYAAQQATKDKNTAAVAGRNAANFFQLTICAENIEDDPMNTTRFLIVGSQDVAPSGKDKTSLILTTSNRPGAIYELLAPFAEHNVSMSRLESRPSNINLWEYVFFLDIQGHQQDENVSAALNKLGQKAAHIKMLGSYPTT